MGAVDKLWEREHRTTWAGYPAHPAANAWPMMEGEEWEAMLEGLRATDGDLKHNKIILGRVGPDGDWQVLDGRNRIRALATLGIEITEEHFVFEEFGNDLEIWVYVHRQNFARRHCSASQLGMQGAIFREHVQAVLDGRQTKSIRGVAPKLNMTPEEEEEWMRTAPDAPLVGPLFAALLDETGEEPPETTQEPPGDAPETTEPADAPDEPEPSESLQEAPTEAVPPEQNNSRISRPNPSKQKRKTDSCLQTDTEQTQKEKRKGKTQAGLAVRVAAKMTGASTATIYRSSQILNDGVPELSRAVLDGVVSTALAAQAVKRLSEDQQRQLASTGTWPEDVPKVGNGTAKPKPKRKRGKPPGAKSHYADGILFAFQEAQRQLGHKRRNAVASMGIDALLGHIDMLVRRINNGAEGIGEHRGGEADLHLLMTAVTRLTALRYEERARAAETNQADDA